MALDKYRILSELGSVVNQLQNADCGCMGKLFGGDSGMSGHVGGGMTGTPSPTYGGYGHGYSGYSGHGMPSGYMSSGMPGAASMPSGMPDCYNYPNPNNLYRDTYNYLSQNLMQPMVKEVYDDMNSPPANTAGGTNGMAGPGMVHPNSNGNQMYQMPGNQMNDNHMALAGGNPMTSGMGPQIMEFMNSPNQSKSPSKMPGTEQSGSANITPIDPSSDPAMGGIPSKYVTNNMMTPTTQYVSHDNMYTVDNAEANPDVTSNMGQNMNSSGYDMNIAHNMNTNMGMIPGGMVPTGGMPPMQSYGNHTPGIAKFKEMFPESIQEEKDLGFDPMGVALQMNPSNQQAKIHPNQRQVYNAETGVMKFPMDPNTKYYVDVPNVNAVNAEQGPKFNEGPQPPQGIHVDPIYPVDTKKNPLNFQPKMPTFYNTLGQHIWPMTKYPGSKLNVKSTMSKTALTGVKPIGRMPSRGQLQKVYQSFRGSQSYTNNIGAPPAGQGGSHSHSDGKLHTTPANCIVQQSIPVEKVGGDTAANNQMTTVFSKVPNGQVGDVPVPQVQEDKKMAPKRRRNGLQDLAPSTHLSHVSWSFHGEPTPVHVPAAFKTRDRYWR